MLSEETQVQSLQQFRQLIFKCAVVWLMVTLAFAEVCRILALSVPFTGAGVGLMIPLQESAANLQFGSRAGYLYLMLVLVVEVLNSAVEAVVDRWGAEHNELAGRAKDMGSAAVFLSDMNVLICWGLILLPRIPN